MVSVSLAALMLCLTAFISEGRVPFSTPISLLGDPQHLGTYRLVLAGLLGVAVVFFYRRCRVGDLCDALLSGFVTLLLLLLFGTPNLTRGHDELASTLMVVTSVMSLGIAQRLADHGLLMLTMASLISCSLLFSEQLLVMGIVEGVVLGTAVLAMNAACRAPVVSAGTWYVAWSWPGTISTPWWWRPGMGAGLCWGVYCLLVSGMCQAFSHASVVAGPVVLIACTLIGFVAWREEMFFSFRAPLVFGGYALVMFLLRAVDAVSLQPVTLAGMVVLMGMTLVTMLFIDLWTS